jgi:hypothetical protein
MSIQTKCEICAHSQRSVIDSELAAGEHPGNLADAFGVSAIAVRRHKRACLGQTAPAHSQVKRSN